MRQQPDMLPTYPIRWLYVHPEVWKGHYLCTPRKRYTGLVRDFMFYLTREGINRRYVAGDTRVFLIPMVK